MERSDDRERREVRSPTQKILEKVERGKRITPDEKRHLQQWIKGKRSAEPSVPKWIGMDLDIRALKTE
jgi:hypothetical protein